MHAFVALTSELWRDGHNAFVGNRGLRNEKGRPANPRRPFVDSPILEARSAYWKG